MPAGVYRHHRFGVRASLSQFYLDHFGFLARPFSILPDPEMLFWSDRHRKAFAVLEYGLMTRAPLTVVTGEVGAGKTTLIQALLRRVDSDMRVGLISNARGDRGDVHCAREMAAAEPAGGGIAACGLFRCVSLRSCWRRRQSPWRRSTGGKWHSARCWPARRLVPSASS